MKNSTFKYLFFIFSLLILLSCGGGSGAIKSEISQPLVATNSNGDIVVKGKILINSNGNTDTTVSLSNIVFRSEENGICVLDYTPNIGSVIDITNGAEINFEVTIDGFCKNVNSLIFEADKIIKYTYTSNGVQKEKKRVEKYSKKIDFQNITSYDNFIIEIDPKIAQISKTTTFFIRITDKLGNEINDNSVINVVVKSSDSSKLTLLNEQNISVNEIIYSNLSYKDINIKAKSGSSGKLIIQAILKSGSNNYKIAKDFDIEIQGTQNFSNQKFKINLVSGKSFTVDSIEKFTIEILDRESEEPIDEAYVTNVNISTTHKLIKFSENNSGDINDNYNKDSFIYNKSKNKIVYIKTEKVSGLETLKISVVLDINDSYEENISQEFTIPIVSGPPNTISLIYVSSSYDNGLYSDRYRIQAVDKYGNPARVSSRIYVGAVSGLVKDANGNDIYVNAAGTIEKSSEGIKFKSNYSNIFANVSTHDTLVILSNDNRIDSSYLGGWIISDIKDNNTLILEGDFNITAENGLSFLVGNEKRYDPCEQQPKSVDFDSEDNTYELQEDGTTYFTLRYPPFMVGKDVYLYANSYDEKRVGVSMRKKLWGTNDITANEVSCSGTENSSTICYITITFNLQSSQYYLLQQEFSEENFALNGYCNNFIIDKNNTTCSGDINLSVVAPAKETCTITWDNSIPYEH